MQSNNDSMRTPREMTEVPFKHVSAPPLEGSEAESAMQALRATLFPKIERSYADPAIPNQTYALVSFVPSKGASPDADGMYGVMKIRGVYASVAEADERSEYLIKNVDSNHVILTTFVGRPFPVIPSGADSYGAEVRKIELSDKTQQTLEADDRKHREDERRQVEDIKKREQNLVKDVEIHDSERPIDEQYTMLRVKLAQLTFTAYDYRRRIDDIKKYIVKAHDEALAAEKAHPEVAAVYMDKYRSACAEAGVDNEVPETSFVKYMDEKNINMTEIMSL